MTLTDQAKPPREGEELSAARVESFLKENIPGLAGSLEILQFPSGHSNLTYLLKVGDTEMVLRRPPFGRKAATAHDMGREFRILSALHPVFPYCPRPLAYTADEAVLGAPFYVMERLKGIILRKDLPPELGFTPGRARALCEELVDVRRQQAGDVATQFRPAGTAGLGQEHDQVPQPDEADGVDDPPALARGLGQARPLQRRQMEGQCGRRHTEAFGDFPRRQAVRPLRHQQA